MQESPDDPISAAREAIWDLFDAGLTDEDHTTTALLAVSIGVRRMEAHSAAPSGGAPPG